jgi:hypothetical protein
MHLILAIPENRQDKIGIELLMDIHTHIDIFLGLRMYLFMQSFKKYLLNFQHVLSALLSVKDV